MLRKNRAFDELRPIEIIPNFLKDPAGSALIRWGNTWVLCTASIEEKVPAFLLNQQKGWITAEYSMLPGSVKQRVSRASNGRSKEIERLIGRSLRAAVNFEDLGTRTITIDCDVLQADGGTRTAAITGGFVALTIALHQLKTRGLVRKMPLQRFIAATSVGLVQDQACLDLEYEEDVTAQVDMNIVMAHSENQSQFIELQGTAESKPFNDDQLLQFCQLGKKGIMELFEHQKIALTKAGVTNL